MTDRSSKRRVLQASLVVILMMTVVMAPVLADHNVQAASDYWTYTVKSAGTVTKTVGTSSTQMSPAGSTASTSNVGSWAFDANGYGPFGSFYAAFDYNNQNQMKAILNPNDLTKTIWIWDDSKSELVKGVTTLSTGYNIMWVLPTVYWAVENGDLILSNDPAKGTAYAHTGIGDDGKAVVYQYLAYAVYEGAMVHTTKNSTQVTQLVSEAGHDPGVPLDGEVVPGKMQYREYVKNNEVMTDHSGESNGVAMLWNFYSYQLYRFIAFAIGGTWDVQNQFGQGATQWTQGENVGGLSKTGQLDTKGPYSALDSTGTDASGETITRPASVKLLLENVWGSYLEVVDGVYVRYNGLEKLDVQATQYVSPSDQAQLVDYGSDGKWYNAHGGAAANEKYQSVGRIDTIYWDSTAESGEGAYASYSGFGNNLSSDDDSPQFWGMPTDDFASTSTTSATKDWVQASHSSGEWMALYVGGEYCITDPTGGERAGLTAMQTEKIDTTANVSARMVFLYGTTEENQRSVGNFQLEIDGSADNAANLTLESKTEWGLYRGTIGIYGVQYKTIGSGDSAVRAYSAIYDPDYCTMKEGDTEVPDDSKTFSIDSDHHIYSAYAVYTWKETYGLPADNSIYAKAIKQADRADSS